MLNKNQVITIVKEFKAGGKTFKEGMKLSVWMPGEENAKHLLILMGRGGKPLSMMNNKNVFALSLNQVNEGVELGAIVTEA